MPAQFLLQPVEARWKGQSHVIWATAASNNHAVSFCHHNKKTTLFITRQRSESHVSDIIRLSYGQHEQVSQPRAQLCPEVTFKHVRIRAGLSSQAHLIFMRGWFVTSGWLRKHPSVAHFEDSWHTVISPRVKDRKLDALILRGASQRHVRRHMEHILQSYVLWGISTRWLVSNIWAPRETFCRGWSWDGKTVRKLNLSLGQTKLQLTEDCLKLIQNIFSEKSVDWVNKRAIFDTLTAHIKFQSTFHARHWVRDEEKMTKHEHVATYNLSRPIWAGISSSPPRPWQR